MKLRPILEFIREIPDGGAIVVVSDRAARVQLLEEVCAACGGEAANSLVIVVVSDWERTMLAGHPLTVLPFRLMTEADAA